MRKNSYQGEIASGGDPLKTLKKGMLMSSFKQSPEVSGGATSPSITNQQAYARMKNKMGRNSVIDGTHMMNSLVSPSSICESYKNVDFFAIKEPYHVIKNKFQV